MIMKQPTRQMCIDYIRQLVTCENFAQVSFIIDHMPKEIAEEMRRTTKPVGIIPPLLTEGAEFWVKQKQLIEHRGSETEKELTEHLLKSEIRLGEAFVKVVIHDDKIVKQIRRYFRNEEAREAEAWVRNKRR